jgi:hypothetical protein
MRLVNADAYSAEMKDRQEAAWKWRNEAIAEEDELKLARAEGAFTAFTEAKLTMDKHIVNVQPKVEDGLYVVKGGFFYKMQVRTPEGKTVKMPRIKITDAMRYDPPKEATP